MIEKICIIHIEMVSPEKVGIANSKWVVWCEVLSIAPEQEFPATVVEGGAKATQIFQNLVDTHKARGYRVLFNSKEI